MWLAPYLPIVILFGLALAFAVFSVAIAPITGPRRYNRAKLDFYECGIEPTPTPMGPNRFPIKYFLTAMLFIVFDIEIIFLYPWAISLKQSGGTGYGIFLLIEMLLFILTVFVVYAYVWRRGGLDWD